MMENDSSYSEFESLWQQANNPQQPTQVVEVGGIDTDIQIVSLLQQLSQLADSLNNADIIDTHQHDQMLTSIAQLKEVIQTIDPQVLSKVIGSLN
ncbi:hypothetical protein A1359_04350 [Methylomonas lenta]|uniref:Uncharacterized protein n=1 Tax=Methylomonas lenta TaxID=980561 RepID=A0A177NN61_9GAMM|nr:hypothetical protein [Methylomonas lenta]OAI18803.1 hypothetical protein A1359_04350 [Methylomonas lenta]